MEPFTLVTGIAAPLLRDNIDTDAIIPSRETQSVARTGYGEKLFANWRYTPGTRIENPDFVLNREPYRQAKILISRDNFGCGSSREAAVWSLAQFGMRCVIAESFGNIFRNNCIRNGFLPVVLSADAITALVAQVETGAQVTVDLQRCEVRAPDGQAWPFAIGALERDMLLEGLDEVALTLKRHAEIEAFQARDRRARPWIYELERG
jgi:3-isopropylmalate/(R)-2-methylmalate dehydratase small subunit